MFKSFIRLSLKREDFGKERVERSVMVDAQEKKINGGKYLQLDLANLEGLFGIVTCSQGESMLQNKTNVLFTHARIFLGSDKLTSLVFHVVKKRRATDIYGVHDSCGVFHLSIYWFR